MQGLARLRGAFTSERRRIALSAFLLLCGSVALISAEWTIAVLSISLSAIFGASSPDARSPELESPSRWKIGLLLLGGIGLLGLAGADALVQDYWHTVLVGLGEAGALVAAGLGWRRAGSRPIAAERP